MSSIIHGFEYDIFISYRQKDNKGDRWVSEFVEALKTELESTFKEEISVYFDINPHDGLLETHDVDASLKEKLKCLVFIPIISQTYCDPKSFAWEHELKIFAEQASKDQFGLMVKLPNGNVTNRILPVRIHDITECDVKLFETITGSFLRGIDFIYKEPGVNRPLRSNEEDPHNNLNHTTYRNQVNKVANAIKEVITALRHHGEKPEIVSKSVIKTKSGSGNRRVTAIITGSVIVLAFLILGLFFIPKMLRSGHQAEKSIAVLPFKLLSDEPDKQYLADGMMDAITLHLSKIQGLRVMSRTSVEQYRGTTKTAQKIGQELKVEYLLEGSFQKYGDDTKLIVQLIKASEESHIWANEYNSRWSEVFSLQSQVAQKIASELMLALTPEEIETMSQKPTESLEAYQAYLRGRYYADQPHFSVEPWKMALDAFQEAVNFDSTFALAYGELARCHARLIYMKTDMSEERMKMANEAASKALELGSDNPRVHIAIGYYYLYAYRDKSNALQHLEIAEKNLPNDYDVLMQKAEIIGIQGRWYENIELLEKAKQISPNTIKVLTELAESYWLTHQYEKCFAASNQANALNPNDNWPYLYKIFATWSSSGSATGTGELVKHVSKKSEWYVWTQFWQFIGEKNYPDALQFLKDTTGDWSVSNKVWVYPRPLLMALVCEQLGDGEQARINYEASREILEKKIAVVPKDPRYHSAIGLAYAGLGRKEDAIREGLKAVELLPISIDALYGIACVEDLALIYIKVGEYDLALEQIEKLLSIPSWVTPAWMNFDYRFEPLKSHPQYKKILGKIPVGN